MRRTGLLLIFAVGLLVLAPTFSAAQSRLFDGVSLSGQIAASSSAEYNFDASRGDVLAVRVLGLNGLDPMVTVRGPDGTDLFTGFDDPWSPEPGDSLVTFNAPAGGAYSVVVQGEGGSSGDFVLQFNQQAAPPTGILPGGPAVPVPVSAAAGPLRLQFATNTDCPTTLVISPGDPPAQAVVNLHDAQGMWFAQLNASAEQRVTLEADSGLYVAEIVPVPGSADGQLVLTVACAAEQPACTAPPAAEAAPVPTPAGLLMVQPDGELATGEAKQGEIGQASAQLGYTFEGTAGQAIAVQVSGLSFGFQPVLTLLGPTLAQVASAQPGTGGFRPGDAVLRAVLPEDGRYSAVTGSADQAPGAFLIRLAEDPASTPALLSAGVPITVDAAALAGEDGWFQRYTFTALDSCPTALDIQTAGGFPLALGVVVRHAGGEVVGQFAQSQIVSAALAVPAGSGEYEVLVPRYGDLDALGQITLSVSCQADSAACSAGGSTLLISTPTPGAAPADQPTSTLALQGGEFTGIVSAASANVRRGDSQAFSVIHALTQGTQVAVIGVSNSGSGWFKVRLDDGAEGWMSPQVLTVSGDTAGLPRLSPPAAPAGAPTSAPGGGGNSGGGNTGGGNAEGNSGGGASGEVCGNGTCEANENPTGCYQDCGYCTDGTCNSRFEDQYSCQADCPAVCGDADCNSTFEDAGNCPADCPGWCGDGVCNGAIGEDTSTCPDDCSG